MSRARPFKGKKADVAGVPIDERRFSLLAKRGSVPPPMAPGAGAQQPAAPAAIPLSGGTAAGVTRRGLLRSATMGTMGAMFATTLVGGGMMLWPATASGFGDRVLVPVPLDEVGTAGLPLTVRQGKFYLLRVPGPSHLLGFELFVRLCLGEHPHSGEVNGK